jgi:hypothetical protein
MERQTSGADTSQIDPAFAGFTFQPPDLTGEQKAVVRHQDAELDELVQSMAQIKQMVLECSSELQGQSIDMISEIDGAAPAPTMKKRITTWFSGLVKRSSSSSSKSRPMIEQNETEALPASRITEKYEAVVVVGKGTFGNVIKVRDKVTGAIATMTV